MIRRSLSVRWIFRPALMLLFLFLNSCDLFTTRTPETPDLGSTFIWTPAATPNYLLDNFSATMTVLDATNYAKCFIGSKDSASDGSQQVFTFSPRPALDPNIRVLFDQWNVQSERNFMTKLAASLVTDPKLTVKFSNVNINQVNSNSADITLEYLVLLPVQSNSTIPPSISGSMGLHIIVVTTEEQTKEWRIVNWSDFAQTSGNAKTFTELKSQVN
ncbi:MAG: hypothetical protein ABI778_01375 [Ignavibacteriota bacterium]